jgi:hypothetical protein
MSSHLLHRHAQCIYVPTRSQKSPSRYSEGAVPVMVAVSFSAMASVSTASAPGRSVAVAQEIKDFFSARGADPVYLGIGSQRWVYEQVSED